MNQAKTPYQYRINHAYQALHVLPVATSATGKTRVQQLLLQHSLALRKRAVGLTYASWLNFVEQSSLQSTNPQLNSEAVSEVLTSVKCS